MKKIFETERLIFRELQESDFDDLKKIIPVHEDDFTKRWLNWCLSSYQKEGFGLWAVIYKSTGELIANCGISMQPIDDEWRKEIGYHIRKDYHHMGLGKEAARGIRDYFFSHYQDNEIYSYMDDDNIASYKTAEANGMKYIKNFISKDGKNCRIYKITREEWNKQK